MKSPLWGKSSDVLLYASLTDEPDTAELIDAALREGKTTALPRIEGNSINFYRIEGREELIKNDYGILEPPPRGLWLPSSRSSPNSAVCLLPGRALSPDGSRLGRGGGFYDRFLCEYGARLCSVGLCFAIQVFPAVPAGEHDEFVDYICTEEGLKAAKHET